MPAFETRGYATAVVGLLTGAGLSVYDGEAPAKPLDAAPYVLFWASIAGFESTLGDRYAHARMDFQTTSVGLTAEQARWVADKVTVALLGVAPVISGRTAQPINATEAPQPVRRDDDEAQPLFYVPCRWQLLTTP